MGICCQEYLLAVWAGVETYDICPFIPHHESSTPPTLLTEVLPGTTTTEVPGTESGGRLGYPSDDYTAVTSNLSTLSEERHSRSNGIAQATHGHAEVADVAACSVIADIDVTRYSCKFTSTDTDEALHMDPLLHPPEYKLLIGGVISFLPSQGSRRLSSRLHSTDERYSKKSKNRVRITSPRT
ncbi:hypothetical protein BJ508DRAFT_339570 [Ascobolus immersus RN42]|uniref:Uncharacterized protein n=1 Tax=Ascobolus immersus RN42 TaxID=1160509 RepID=A0A3N4HM39_ASCIM|nr:hypothetical protein BJ508DRAFT_339570 [Ascobolus immersus RN42]